MLDDPLLVRNGRKLVPTPRALALAPQVAAVVADMRCIFAPELTFDPLTCERRFTLASGAADILLGIPPKLAPEHRSEPAYAERLCCAVWRGNRRVRGELSLEQFLGARHIQVALQGKYPIDFIDTVLAQRGQQRDIALSVPQCTLAASCLVGTCHIAMLPETMAKQLAKAMPLRLCSPPLPLPPITVVQVWHVRPDDDPGGKLRSRAAVLSVETPVAAGAHL